MEQSTLNPEIPKTNKNLIKIHEHVRQVKTSEEIEVKFMQRWEEEAMWKKEGREDGLAEGQFVMQLSIVRFQYFTKRKTPENISDDLGLPLERVTEICTLLTKYPQKSDNEIAKYLIKTE